MGNRYVMDRIRGGVLPTVYSRMGKVHTYPYETGLSERLRAVF